MSYNGSGTFQINTAGQPVVSGTVISSTAFNALTADLATGLSTCITKDGQTTPTANIPMGNNKITGLAVGTAATDAANLSQVQSTAVKLLVSVSGADTVTAAGSPSVAAYVAGQMFYWVAAGDNTGPVTLNIDGLGAKAVTRDGSVALAAGDIKSGEVVVVVYDGTRFQVVSQINSGGDARFANVSITSALNVGGVATFTGGTANGVTYLNGSKVLTSGTALVFDGTNLGIGTSSPGYKLDVAGTLRVLNGSTSLIVDSFGAVQAPGGVYVNTTGTRQAGINSSGNDLKFRTGNTDDRMVLDNTGNLGLGITPSAWGTQPAIQMLGGAFWGVNAANFDVIQNGYYNGTNYIYRNTNLASRYNQNAGVHSWFTAPSGTAGNTISFTQAMTLDASGNLGLGVTPSAWSSTLVKAIQIGDNNGSISSYTTGNTSADWLLLNNNAYYDAGGWKYIASSTAAQYAITANEHRWYNAGSGTAGNAISFTQAMTLDASGNLLVGTTSNIGAGAITAIYSAGGNALHVQSGNASANNFVSYNSTGTATATLTNGGALTISGALSKGSGSFRIDHPLKPDTHQLVHSFIEGPQADLIYRGKATLVNGKAVVNIDEAAGMTEGTFVALCREIQCFTSNECDWDAVRGSVSGNKLIIECQNPSSSAVISWLVIGERQDKHMYDTDWTDENGKVIVEPEKAAN